MELLISPWVITQWFIELLKWAWRKLLEELSNTARSNPMTKETLLTIWNVLIGTFWIWSVYRVANSHAPIKKSKVKGSHNPWMTSALSKAMQDRDRHHRKAVKSNNHDHWKQCRKLKNYTNKDIKKSRREYHSRIITENKGNSNALWKIPQEVTSS